MLRVADKTNYPSSISIDFEVLLFGYLRSLSSHFSSTSQGSVNLSSEQRDGQVNGHVLQSRDIDLILERRAGAEEVELKQLMS